MDVEFYKTLYIKSRNGTEPFEIGVGTSKLDPQRALRQDASSSKPYYFILFARVGIGYSLALVSDHL